MGFSATILLPHIPASYRRHCFKFRFLRAHERHKALSFVTTRCCALHGINSVLRDRKSSINSNGAPEPTTSLLERLFAQTQKLEEHMHVNSHYFQDVESDLNIENLESDFEAALEALRIKEEDLHEAERMVMLEHAELKQAKEELERREEEIAAACSKQEKLEVELRQANLKLISQARHVEDLKLRLKEREQEITAAESALLLKDEDLDKLTRELTQKNEEASKTEAQLIAKAQLLDEANDVVKKQDIELRELRNALLGKQREIEELLCTQQLEAGKLKSAETKLERQTMEWLRAQEELKKLGEEASRHMKESKETLEDFQRVKRLLVDVRSELVSSQKSWVTSRQKMKEQELVLEKQLLELEEQKETIMSYMNSLKSAQIEVESERAKLRVAESRNKELELDLSLKRDLLKDLQEKSDREKCYLQQAINEASFLEEELNKKNSEFEETSSLLQSKEKELVDAKLEIQHLIFEQNSLQLILQERDLELINAKKRLEEVNAQVTELKVLLNKKEEQLILTTGMLKEKDDYAEAMQHDLDDARHKASEAETVVGRIVDLTKELVISTNEDILGKSSDLEKFRSQLLGKPAEDYRWQKTQLEAELESTKEILREKEMELLAAQRQLAIKDEELKMVLQRLEEKGRNLKELEEEKLRDADDLKFSILTQERLGQNGVDDLAIEKLQLEAAQLEVEAATSALQKLAEMSRELLNKASLSMDADLDVNVFPQNGFGPKSWLVDDNVPPQNAVDPGSDMVESNECLSEFKSEVARLSALTESDLDVPIKKFAKKKKKLVRNNAMQVQVVDPQLLDDINKSCGHKDIENREVCIQVQDTQNQGEEHLSGHNKKRKRKQLVTREPLQKGGMSSKNANTLGKNKVEITLNPRHTVQQFMQLIKGLEGQDDKLRAIRDMGFGGLMHLNFPRNDTVFAAKLMRDFDPYGMCILLDRNRDIKVDAIDVHLVYGISIGGEVIVEGKDEDEKFYELLENWKQYHGGGVPSLKAIVEKLLNHGVNVDDNWRRSFLVLVVNTCIKSNSNTQPLYRFLSTTFDTTRISSYDWCKYTLDSLSEWAIYWKKNTTRFFPGPLPFLMICYFDRLQRQTFSHTRLFPLISSWRLEDIKKRISSESEYGFGCGALLDRIEKPVNMDISIPTHLLSEEGQSCQRQCEEEQHPQVDDPQSTNEQQNHKHQAEEQEHLEPPSNLHEINTQLREATLNIALCFVRVTTLLKSVENFYPNTLINNIMMQNVATMWSRCSGSQMPPDIQQFSKKCVGGSLLSQDNEIFSSEWFGEMVDSAVKRVVGESEQVLPCCGEEQPTPLQPLIFNSDTHHPMNENHSESDLNFDNLDFNEIFGDEDNANDQQCDHNLEKVTKRMRKLPAIFKSPYLIQYSHLVDEEEDDKICILEYALSAKLPKDEELYDDGSTFLNREYCLSLGSDGHIFGELIDAWCHILNSRNKLNRKEKRIFFPNAAFNLLCMNDYYGECTQKDTIEFRQSKFFETLDFTMYENKIDTIKGFNLVFFIVHAWSHFYVMCINMKAKTLDILDNRILEDGIPLESKYRDYPRKVLEAFSLFLHRAEYKCYRHVAKFKIRLIEMPWRSNMNTVDCGVYAMRHMETYHAQNNWDCGLYSDNFEGLKKLRIQYCIDLLTDNANDKRVELQVLARKFKKLENNE